MLRILPLEVICSFILNVAVSKGVSSLARYGAVILLSVIVYSTAAFVAALWNHKAFPPLTLTVLPDTIKVSPSVSWIAPRSGSLLVLTMLLFLTTKSVLAECRLIPREYPVTVLPSNVTVFVTPLKSLPWWK